MKKLLLICGLLWSALASAQFVPRQILTAAELNSQFILYAPLTGATFTGPLTSPSITSTSTTQGRLDNSTSLATDAFVNQQGASAVATVPFAGVTGGTYNQATLGSGCQVVVFASGGVITSSLTISNPGSGYSVGDLMAVPAGNSDAVLRVTGVSGGGVTSVGIAYGGTGYSTGAVATAMSVPPGRRAVVFTGTLTSNLTFIIQNGTFLTASREVEFINNTTGAFTITVKLSNGAGGSAGTGVVLPQGTSNSTALAVYTDGVNDVWLANAGAAVVGGPGAFTTLSASSTVSGAGFTTLLGAYAPLAGVTFTGPASLGYSNPQFTLNDTSAGGKAAVQFQRSAVAQWNIGNSSASNVLAIDRFVSGSYVDSPLSISNSTGVVTMSDGITNTPISGSTGSFTTLAASSTVSGTGFSNYLASPPAIGATAASTGKFTSLQTTGTYTPSSTAGIVGTTVADNAQAGSWGECITATGTAVSLSTAAAANITSVGLSAGDWFVYGNIEYDPGGTTTYTQLVSGINTTSATLPASPLKGIAQYNSPIAGTAETVAPPPQRLNISSSGTAFLVGFAAFSVSTLTATGQITACRRR